MPFPKAEIRPRHSMAFFAILSISMVIVSYAFSLCLAAACAYLPYRLMSFLFELEVQRLGIQVVIFIVSLVISGVVVAGTLLWSLVPRPDEFAQPGPLLERA